MQGVSLSASYYLPEMPQFKKAKHFIDMGGSMGHLAISIAKKHPHLTGVVCELAECKAPCEENIKL